MTALMRTFCVVLTFISMTAVQAHEWKLESGTVVEGDFIRIKGDYLYIRRTDQKFKKIVKIKLQNLTTKSRFLAKSERNRKAEELREQAETKPDPEMTPDIEQDHDPKLIPKPDLDLDKVEENDVELNEFDNIELDNQEQFDEDVLDDDGPAIDEKLEEGAFGNMQQFHLFEFLYKYGAILGTVFLTIYLCIFSLFLGICTWVCAKILDCDDSPIKCFIVGVVTVSIDLALMKLLDVMEGGIMYASFGSILPYSIAFILVLKEEFWKGFCAGVIVMLIKTAITCALLMVLLKSVGF